MTHAEKRIKQEWSRRKRREIDLKDGESDKLFKFESELVPKLLLVQICK
jgi:hypothetical protein